MICFLAPRGILGGECRQLKSTPARADRRLHAGNGLRFVVLDANQYRVGGQDMGENVCTLNQLVGPTLHQRIVGRDVGLTFGTVNQQRLNGRVGPGLSFTAVGKPAPPNPAIPASRIARPALLGRDLASRHPFKGKPADLHRRSG